VAIITISRGAFSGGKEFADCIARGMGYRLVSWEMLVAASTQYGIPQKELEHALADKPGMLERIGVETIHYLAYIQSALYKEIQYDGVVYYGYAGHILLRKVPHIFRVRIIANMESRIKLAMTRTNLRRKEAINYIKQRDNERAEWTKHFYNMDLNDPNLYDLIINFNQISPNSASKIVCSIAKKPVFQYNEQVRYTMENLILGADVRAEIAIKANGRDKDVEVEMEDGIVILSGVVSTMEDADLIKRIAIQVPGVKDLKSLMKIVTYE